MYSIANCTAVVVDLALVFSVIVFSDEQCVQFSEFLHCKPIAALCACPLLLHMLHSCMQVQAAAVS